MNPSQQRNTNMQSQQPGAPVRKRKKKPSLAKRILIHFLRFCVVMLCLCVIGGSVVGVLLSRYVVDVTENDGDLLNLDSVKLAQTSIIYARNHDSGEWEEYATLSSENHRIWVDLANIPENLQWAFICTEDQNFYNEKYGVNFKRTIAAAVNEYSPVKLFSSRTGASTLEQQLIKNLTGDDEQDSMRKVREIFRAIGVSHKYSKQTILESYLNTISLSGTIAGVQAGANEYFNKDVGQLTLAECATIASITKNPTKYNPYTNPEELLIRRNDILYFMFQQGKITEAECDAASAEPLVLHEKQSNQSATKSSNNSYFTDALFTELVADIQQREDCTEAEARSIIYTGGLRIYATVDPYVQEVAENIMLDDDGTRFPALWREQEVSSINEDEDIVVYSDDGVTPKTGTDSQGNTVYYRKVRTQAALTTLDYDGNVIAVVGGIGEKTQDLVLNRATIPRPTGSTMKPLAAYCLGVEYKVVNYSSTINDTAFYQQSDHRVLNVDYCRAHGYSTTDLYSPATLADENAWRKWPSNYSGTYSENETYLVDGLAQSLNTIAVWVGSYVGVQNMFNFAYDTIGLKHLDPTMDVDYGPIVLGSQAYGVTPVELAAGYSIFNDGSYTEPHYYSEVTTYTGELYLDTQNELTTIQAISSETATIMNRLLSNVLYASNGTARGKAPEGEMDAVAKTGTTSDFKDYTFAGLTPYYVTALWVGYDEPYSLYDMGMKNGNCIQYAWKEYMETIQEGLEYKAFAYDEDVITKTFAGSRTGYYTADNLPGSDSDISASVEAG